MLKLGDGRPLSFLLESVEGGAARGRYSIIGLAPDVVWRATGDARRDQPPRADPPDAFEPEALPTLKSLRALLAASRIDLPPELPPIAAGVFGYLGYDTVRLIEHLPRPAARRSRRSRRHVRAPDPHGGVRQRQGRDDRRHAGPARAGRRRAHGLRARRGAAARRGRGLDAPLPHATRLAERAAGPARARAPTRRRPSTWAWCDAPRSTSPPATSSRSCSPSASRCRSPCRRSRSIARCAAPTPRRSCSISTSAASRWSGPRPEILVRVRDGEVTIRPIAGTRRARRHAGGGQGARDGAARRPQGARRAPDAARPRAQRRGPRRRDRQRARDRAASPIERYSHVMHIVSNVVGRLDQRARRHRRADGGLPGRHGLRRAQGARHGDHRRAGDGEARPLRRLRRLFLAPTARWTPASCCAPRW